MLLPSLWENESFYSPKDVIIVGSGFVGLWSAYYIKKKNPHSSVLIIDRGMIPTGASTRNAGFACFGSITELLSDIEKHGRDEMLKLLEMRFKGLQKIQRHFKKQDIGYEAAGGFELIPPARFTDVNDLRTTIDQLNHALKSITGKTKTFYLSNGRLGHFGIAGDYHLVENPMEGQLHPGKLCEAILQLLQSMGVKFLNGVETLSFEKNHDGISLQTTLSFPLKAKQLLICTNAFAKTLLPELDIKPARGQVLVSSPIENLKLKGAFHFDEGFYYFRNLGNRVLLGGARNLFLKEEETFAPDTSPGVQEELERFMKETILPGQNFSIDYRWSGTMAVGKEKSPIVQQISEGVFCAVRMSGMGVALAPQVGKMVSTMIN